ncbi:S-layer homology domain-containing protein [Sedimentibacter sp. MB35-C1]|uniref:S-layer homology domain-containing protein n=1 Tax=Sedimentibacter sp. MB35-C1 TaxID=3070995 RepID=UPI0027E0744D|nr:S-layer homology domain-containing protein [Sedimentibacter sp. MB35-C1]WMJ78786.1 S-layer homology domain-containing protein [Sedimentibacter sp. MB35-C1]
MTSGNNRAGLEVPTGTELIILGTDNDELTAQGGYYAAGIGGGYSSTPAQAGVITIKGGVINAIGGDADGGTGSGAGIGGGRGGDGGSITIEGGVVTATGGYRASGIGGGTSGTGGAILIKGGDITATGGQYSAGIGGGYGRPMGSITIEGGTVIAAGINGGAGIGGGYITSNITTTYTGGSVLISGGDITATSTGGSGIGSGSYQYVSQRMPVSVTITGGTVNATSTNGAGIGSTHGSITITDGTVIANGGDRSAGIGGRYWENSGTIEISGGDITATGGASGGGAGIGGGYANDENPLDGGTIEISGGTIIATGGEYGAGIGGGYKVGTGTIIITGGDITATGGGGAGIGVGLAGSSGTIVISQAELSISRNSPYTNHAIDAGTSGTIHIGFTGDSVTPSYDPESSRAQVTIDNDGINESDLVLGTCLIAGDGSGDLAGSYIEGVKQVVTYGIKSIDNQTFLPLTEGYGADDLQTISVTIENAGNGTLSNLAVALSGNNSDSFTTTHPLTTELSNQGDATTFMLVPNMGLTAETYTAVVTISADNMSDTGFTVTQVVNEAVSTDKTLISITTQTAITGVVNGTEKTASSLGLPSTVTLITDDGSVQASVTWDVDSCSYDTSVTTGQTFVVDGTVVLPDGVVNSNNISLDISISVTVNEAAATDKTLVSITTPAAITGIANRTEKTASALGLPSTVALVTDDGSIQASVTWDVDSCSYEPSVTKAQAFAVKGTVTLPNGVINPSNVPLTTEINVSVRARSSGGGNNASSPSKPSTPEYKAVVESGNSSNTTLPVTVDKNSGSAAVNISTDGNLIPVGQTAVVTVPSVPGADTYLLGVPVPNLNTPEEQSEILFKTDYGNVTVPSNMLTGITAIGGRRAEISVGHGDKSNLSDDVKAAIGNRPLVRLTLSIDGRQTDWSNPTAPVTVSIPYTPTEAELDNTENIVVWYIDNSGNPQCITNGRYDLETGMVTFDATHFSNYAVAYNNVSFNDVAESAWYNNAVSFIAAREITGGTGDGNYSPEARLTRGEFMVMMMKTYGISPDENTTHNFADAGDTYYTGYLAAAKRLGISAGVGNNMYAPDKEITRQEMVALLYNALKVIDQIPTGNSGRTLSDFADAGQINPWALDAMTLLVNTGTIGGSGGNIYPASTTTRAEMAQVLYNLLGK